MFPICSDCGSDDIVEDRSCGELVCRKCGLVIQSHLFDDRAPPAWSTLADHYDMVMVPQHQDTRLKEVCEIMHINKQGIDSIKKVYTDGLDKLGVKPRGDNMKAFMAACIYIGCERDQQSRVIEDICRVVGVSCMPKFHHMCGVIREGGGGSLGQGSGGGVANGGEKLLVRMLNKIQDRSVREMMTSDRRWKLIKTCKSIHEFANKNPVFRGKMPSKTNAAVIYIACMAMKIKITKKSIAQDLGVSVVTLSEHEKVIIAMKTDKGLG